MVHNFYIDFLKSFKTFLAGHFPAITTYQFNYSDKTVLNHNLYNEHAREFPAAIVNLTDIRVEDNAAFFRQIGSAYADNLIQNLCENKTIDELVIMDFKWVTLAVQAKINVNSPTDLFNYHNYFLTTFPKNFMFYAYNYSSYIEVESVIQNWSLNDETEGLYYRLDIDEVKGFALYNNQPLIKINEVSKNKGIDGESSVLADFEIYLKVPNVIGKSGVDNRVIDGIQIVINQMGDSKMPILIDMNNDIYSDRRKKMSRIYLLEQSDFNTTDNTVIIPLAILPDIQGKKIGIYMVDDSTSTEPNIIFYEHGLLLDSEIGSSNITLTISPDNITNFNFCAFNILELLIFN